MNDMVAGHGNAMVTREEFGAMQTQQNAATAEGAIAAQMQAAVNARYIMAMRRPRDWLQVRAMLLKDCRRLRFAGSAIYQKPIGREKFATGLSIRFAEAVLRCAGNVSPEVTILYDDERKRLIRVQVSDLESNVTYAQDVIIEKTVERSQLRKGQTALSQRINSYGSVAFLVEANEGELLTKEGAIISKAMRTLVLRLLPGDIADDCRDAIEETISKGDAADPQAAIKAVADGFMKLNIQPEALSEYLGDDISRASPAQISGLRKIFTAVRDGEVTWGELMESRRTAKTEGDDGEAPAPAEGSRSKQLAGRIKAKAQSAAPQALEQAAQPEPSPEEGEDYDKRAAWMAARAAKQD